jgi:hypothetical protein
MSGEVVKEVVKVEVKEMEKEEEEVEWSRWGPGESNVGERVSKLKV